MTEIPKIYDPSTVEDKWYNYWLKQNFFKSVPDEREPYTIVIPPPNVTGVLHMGHMMNNTLQDVFIRRARMLGKNACWVPGTDHASIATEAKVVAMLKEKGISKSDLTREEFLKYAWEWKEKYGGIILEQLKKLGASCDWDRTRFTMEDDLSEAVIDVFIDLYNKGYIYRGVRMVNWDPQGMTAVSDEEVIHKEVNSKLYYVRYILLDENEKIDLDDKAAIQKKFDDGNFITIATVRPETILGDTAVCVHPDDERYKNLKGKKAVIPFVNRIVKIIFDDYITMEFGTGALKVTPAHDINDYNLGVKYGLEVIDTIDANGKMSEKAGFYIGEDRFAVRKKIAKDLEDAGHIIKVEEYKNKVGYSERTNAVIEPKLSLQWFLKMDTISKPALENVLNGNINLIPDKFLNTYKHWMENVHDWCISRQLWWGQRIPAWYLKSLPIIGVDSNGKPTNLGGANYDLKLPEYVVEKSIFEAVNHYNRILNEKGLDIKIDGSALKQEEDVVDTWFSSWLWPISVFDGFKNPDNKDINYYYPTNDLITAPEILFFWVARMIIAGYEYKKEKPFTNVYLTGIVRDKQGRKMSKSLGNSPDPLDLIAKFGADGVRVGMLLCSPAGNDLPFDESLCEQGRNFSNKIWNAFRLIKGWTTSDDDTSEKNQFAIDWFSSKLSAEIAIINDHYSKYRISDALMATYKLVWDDFCAWYLEIVKPDFIDGQSQPIDHYTYNSTIEFLEDILKLMHPFMPFITEEIWHLINEREEQECIIISEWPDAGNGDEKILSQFAAMQEIIVGIRTIRNEKNISPKESLELFIRMDHQAERNSIDQVIKKLCNLSEINYSQNKIDNAASFISGNIEFFVPLTGRINVDDEKEKLKKEIDYNKGFLKSVMAKLSNEKFVANAKPEIIANEEKKKNDAVAKIKVLEEQLNGL